MVLMSDNPVLEPSFAGRWMRDNRRAASITLGIGIGLVWGITTGVGFAVLIGYGVIGTWRCSCRGPCRRFGVGVAIYKERSPSPGRVHGFASRPKPSGSTVLVRRSVGGCVSPHPVRLLGRVRSKYSRHALMRPSSISNTPQIGRRRRFR